MLPQLAEQAAASLEFLCVDLPDRCVGSAGNRAATDFFAQTIAQANFTVTQPAFDCMDWHDHGTTLSVDDETFPVQTGPYSPGGQISAPLVVISTVAELEAADLSGQIALLRGEIAREQLMPKNFPFYNPDEHRHIVGLLEAKQPAAIISATGRNPDLAGALYPFPLIEDGDFDIPNAFLTDIEGERLAAQTGQRVALDIQAERRPSTGCNVVARKGARTDRRAVVFAHIDAKLGTPGALDNGAGVTTLLLLAALLADYEGELGIEIVALNGEDHYAAPGELRWLRENEGRMDEIALGINLDGLGYREGQTAYSLYGCPPELDALIRAAMADRPTLAEGQPWFQSDHGLFLMHERPTLALTSDAFDDLWTRIAHTPDDVPALVDPAKLVEAAAALRDILLALDEATA